MKYINFLPIVGFFSSLTLLIFFFLIIGVKETERLRALLYCLLPFFVFTIIPIKLIIKKIYL
ncbi:hypothetical protein D3Z33_13870 [Senegalia massiliensis]|uniref:Uncharacterized protein n=1 Tax=Senegalia massiliensis TaxID=1720316 RepID=A0A845R113_9CLOT|nr:hypothetical protein [Senegalia massiliensis]